MLQQFLDFSLSLCLNILQNYHYCFRTVGVWIAQSVQEPSCIQILPRARNLFFFPPKCPDWSWSLLSLLVNKYQGTFLWINLPECEVTIHPHLELRLIMGGAIYLHPLYVSMPQTQITSPFIFYLSVSRDLNGLIQLNDITFTMADAVIL